MFAGKLRRKGLNPICSPVMRIEFNRSAPSLAGVSAIAFTSANGVRAMAPHADRAASLPVFAVGEVTAAAARKAGYAAVHSAGGDVAGLVDLIAERFTFDGVVLHPAGRDTVGGLTDALRARGVRARKAVMYEAKPIEELAAEAAHALAENPPAGWVTLFSPRSASLFLDQIERAGLRAALTRVKAACLSDSVASAAEAAAWDDIRVAPGNTAEGLISLICQG